MALHLGAYRRYDAGAVVHAHPPVSTALACVIDEVPAIHYQMVALGGTVRVARYATFGTTELAEITLDALQDRFAVLMANHGALTYGQTLESAVERARLLEWVCTVYSARGGDRDAGGAGRRGSGGGARAARQAQLRVAARGATGMIEGLNETGLTRR